jgi:hypothetical protein
MRRPCSMKYENPLQQHRQHNSPAYSSLWKCVCSIKQSSYFSSSHCDNPKFVFIKTRQLIQHYVNSYVAKNEFLIFQHIFANQFKKKKFQQNSPTYPTLWKFVCSIKKLSFFCITLPKNAKFFSIKPRQRYPTLCQFICSNKLKVIFNISSQTNPKIFSNKTRQHIQHYENSYVA